MRPPRDDETPIFPLRALEPEPEPAAGRSVLVIADGFVAAHPLADEGSLVLGRSAEADLPIEVEWLSRRHARLHLGHPLEIEDLGSANGTFVGDTRLARGERRRLAAGDIVNLGPVQLLFHDAAIAISPRHIWDREPFVARIEQECERARASATGFAVIHVRTADRDARARAIQPLLIGSLRPCDLIAHAGTGRYDVLFVGARPGEGHAVIRRLEEQSSAGGSQIRLGVAYYPRDGSDGPGLLARARAEADDDERQSHGADHMVLVSEQMQRLHSMVERVARSRLHVLLLGETGVGKEVIAERIHALSSRFARPFVRINCATLAAPLLESQLFGHVRGAFTGADRDRVGLLDAADGGTLFLDEVAEMPMEVQAKLLRVLEDGKVARLGAIEFHAVDVRVIAATNCDLEEAVVQGAFRADLFHRLDGASLVIPPLRERREEIAPLARAFVARGRRRMAIEQPITLSDQALAFLHDHDWPGNLRELRNVIERAMVLSDGLILPEHLPLTRFSAPKRAAPLADPEDDEEQGRAEVVEALARAGGNQSRAAKLLGISRGTLIARIARYGLPRPRKRD